MVQQHHNYRMRLVVLLVLGLLVLPAHSQEQEDIVFEEEFVTVEAEEEPPITPTAEP